LFPLPEPSAFQPGAPVLTGADIAALRNTPDLRQRLGAALHRMLAFYGLNPPGPHPWLTPGNHNFLRLTRILRSLRILGLKQESHRLFQYLADLYEAHPEIIGATTFDYWRRAAASQP